MADRKSTRLNSSHPSTSYAAAAVTTLSLHDALPISLHRWRKVGWVQARKLPVPGGHWALWADAAELKRLARLRGHQRARRDQPLPAELTTPKARQAK